MQVEELRRSPRRKIEPLPVSIVQHCGNQWTDKLHFGEILEVSTTGARIQVISSLLLDVGSLIELLCFPKNVTDGLDMQATPSHLTGGVVWKNEAACQIGVVFTS
jgi:PilZ domain